MVDNKKDLGQVFTPQWVVELILDTIGYTSKNDNILHHKILEPSFGEGIFFYTIIDRLIETATRKKYTKQQIKLLLETNIYGIEYDKKVYDITLHNLNNYVKKYNLHNIQWKLYNDDCLLFTPPTLFHYIVGNPPYIRVQNMTLTMRETIKKFTHSQGNTDLYIIFFEQNISWLLPEGKLGFITPNSWLKNTSQSSFREEIIENRWLEKIIDFGHSQIFSNASTYTNITILNKLGESETVSYSSYDGEKFLYETTIPYILFESNKKLPFVFGSPQDMNFLQKIRNKPYSFENTINVQYGVTTLQDKFFVTVPPNSEKEITRNVVKGSKYKGEPLTQKIFFPYKTCDNKIVPLTEEEFQQYPIAYSHFLHHKEQLTNRDIDKGSQWFQYGRSQALQATPKKKLTFIPVIHNTQKRLQVFEIPENTIIYSGIFITETPEGLPLSEIKTILESEDFCEYLKISGKNMSGGFKIISAKIIKNYRY